MVEADRFLSLWDSAELMSEEPDIGHIVKKVTEADNIPCVMIKWHCEGLEAEKWATWVQDPTVVAATIN